MNEGKNNLSYSDKTIEVIGRMINIGLLEQGVDWANEENRKGEKKLHLKIDRIHDKCNIYSLQNSSI